MVYGSEGSSCKILSFEVFRGILKTFETHLFHLEIKIIMACLWPFVRNWPTNSANHFKDKPQQSPIKYSRLTFHTTFCQSPRAPDVYLLCSTCVHGAALMSSSLHCVNKTTIVYFKQYPGPLWSSVAESDEKACWR